MISRIENQIIQTENIHMNLLNDLQKVFYEPLQEYFESYVIFKYIKDLSNLHSHIRTVYKFSYSNCAMFTSRKSEFVFYYTRFFENLPRAYRYLEIFMSDDSRKEAMQNCLGQSKEKYVDLESRFNSFRPWIIKMKTLFDYLKSCDANYDVAEISNMYEQLMKIHDKIKEDQAMISWIERSEERFSHPVYFQDYGTLWIQNELKVHIHENDITEMRHLFLFDQVLVVASKKLDKLSLETVSNFSDSPMYGSSSTDKLIRLVTNNNKKITIYFSNNTLFDQWQMAFKNSLWKTKSTSNRSLKTKTVFGFYRCFNCDSILTGVYHQAICDANSENAIMCDKACMNVEFPTKMTKADKSAAIICELIETEKALVDSIEVLLLQYKPIFLQNQQISDVNDCYECLKKLFVVHDSLLDNFMHKCGLYAKSCIEYVDLLELFELSQDDLLIHGEYVVLFERVNNLITCNKKLKEDCERYKITKGKFQKYDIKNLLARPFQRIPRYKLLLEQLDSTNFLENEVDQCLKEALGSIDDINAHSNAMKADDCFKRDMQILTQQMTNIETNGNNFLSYGRLKKQGEVKFSFNSKSPKLYYLFIFDFVIIVTKSIEDSKFCFSMACRLQKPMIKPNLQDFKLTLNCEINSSNCHIVLHCDSKSATYEWCEAINSAIDTMYPAGHNQNGCNYSLTTIAPLERCCICQKIFHGSYLQGYECSVNKTLIHKKCLEKTNNVNVVHVSEMNHRPRKKYESKLLTFLRTDRNSRVNKNIFSVRKSHPVDCISQFINGFRIFTEQLENTYEETKQNPCERRLCGYKEEELRKVAEKLSQSHRDLIKNIQLSNPQLNLSGSQEYTSSFVDEGQKEHPKQDNELYSETIRAIVVFLEENILNYGIYVALAMAPGELVDVGILGLYSKLDSCLIHTHEESYLSEPVKSLLSLQINFEAIQATFFETNCKELQSKIAEDIVKLEKIFEFIQTLIDDFEELLKLIHLERRMQNLNMSKNIRLYDYGKLQEDGFLKVKVVSEKLAKKRQIYLFDQIVLFAVKQASILVYDTCYNIEKEQVEMKRNQDGSYSIQLFVSKRSYRDQIIIYFESKVICKKWEAAFNIAIKNTFSNEKVMKLGLKSFKSFEKCSACNEYLVGAYRQGYWNKDTDMKFHLKCVPFKCTGQLKYKSNHRNTKQLKNGQECSNSDKDCFSESTRKSSSNEEPSTIRSKQKRVGLQISESEKTDQNESDLSPDR